LSIEDSSINVAGGVLNLQNAYGSGNIEAFGGKIVMTTDGSISLEGTLAAHTIRTQKISIDTTDATGATLGTVILLAGESEVVVDTKAVTDSSKIFISVPPLEYSVGVSEKIPGSGFVIRSTNPLANDVSIDWYILDEVKN